MPGQHTFLVNHGDQRLFLYICPNDWLIDFYRFDLLIEFLLNEEEGHFILFFKPYFIFEIIGLN